jgi:hypothetical protein
MKTLKLFNAVLAKESKESPYVSERGYVIEPNAVWCQKAIESYYREEALNGNDLNKTFYKSWEKVRTSSRYELYLDQVRHYMSTYGSNFEGEVYLPEGTLDIPDLKIVFKVIKAYTKEEMIDKCLDLLKSGIALKEETVNDLLSILVDELGYAFTGDEGIKNKEAVVKIAARYGVLPKDTMEFFRYVIYRATGDTLIIKNGKAISAIKESSFNPSAMFKKFGLAELSAIFNRFKPLFLAFKGKCPKTINKISKLSKKYHKPLVSNPLNEVTSRELLESDMHWLVNATPFALFKALSACFSRIGGQDHFLYSIRNGKSWVASSDKSADKVCTYNYVFILEFLKTKYDFSGKTVFLPEGVSYALPTSEKMYVGNIPTGTKFFGEKLAAGVYWEDKWGAKDLDLSGLNIGGKIGWNAGYSSESLTYSGDITSAPNGAVEYLHANKGLKYPTLVMNSVYDGSSDCGYKIIVGKGSSVSKKYMMDPNNLLAEAKCQSVQKSTVLGLFLPGEKEQSFVLLNMGAGNARVSGCSDVTNMATKALYQQWNSPLDLKTILLALDAKVIDDPKEADHNLSLDSLEKDSIINIFK